MIEDLSQPTPAAVASATRLIANVSLTRLAGLLVWLVFPLTLALAITRQTLWTDEGFTIWFAAHKTFSSFWSVVIGSRGAPGDSQIVLYLLYMWSWVKAFGASEVALRTANIPFAILFIGAISWASRHLLRQPHLWVLSCLSPFFWFYLNEARPYVALLAFSTVACLALLAYLLQPADYRVSAPWCCLIFLLLAWATHITAAFLFPCLLVVIVAALASDPNLRRNFLRDWLKAMLWCSPAFLALGIFFIRSSQYGINRYGKPGLSNLFYALYEFAGFQGLGPPRNEIRSNPHLSVLVPYWPLLLLGTAALLALAFLLLRTSPDKIVLFLTIGLLTGLAAALEISIWQEFQILGRHLAAFFPLFLLTLMLWLKPALSSKLTRRASIAALASLGVVWAISDLRLVFLDEYQKDSYRAASSIALAKVQSDHGRILWAADPHTAYYYGIQVRNGQRLATVGNRDDVDLPVVSEGVDARNWTAAQAAAYLDASTTPIVLVLGKADAFDAHSAWPALVQQRKPAELARLTAFTIYEWQSTTAAPRPHRLPTKENL
jgi:uncharacterized membrane protein